MSDDPARATGSTAVTELEKPVAPPSTHAPGADSPGPAASSPVLGTPFVIESLLLSGKRKRWTVGTDETVDQVRQRIFVDWPQEWKATEHPVTSPDSIRLLYLGKFLDPTALLSTYNLKPPEEEAQQQPTIVHLHIRTLPDSSGVGDSGNNLKGSSTSGCRCCVVS